ncbi:Aste57867_11299 [Aphanomyces stellatus]|uniref:Aste57867_11299 protein n=1 Tax=Aphanomyces stellatus TaxID=120398 RepID=A0A485KSI9_9STRA|nr:hypothetical protein As57867_011257 [Aphanomyces stellatus]VFT88161.1 Aste57867_11299 [Aphanomyces stellatus]
MLGVRKVTNRALKLDRKGTKPHQNVEDKYRAKTAVVGSGNSQLNPDDEDYMKSVIEKLEQDLARRQESYVRRERQYQVRIEELERMLSDSRAKKSSSVSHDDTMNALRGVHKNILVSISQVQERTGKILQEQEKDLLRAFRARLYSVQEELETEKNKTDDGASAWIDKSKQLETEVEWTKEMADRLDRLNQSLTRENQRLKTQFSMQENDREFLVRQLVSVKKDNVRLRKELADALKDAERIRDETLAQFEDHEFGGGRLGSKARVVLPLPTKSTSTGEKKSIVVGGLGGMKRAPSTAGLVGNFAPSNPEVDNRYKEIIKRLKRVLETERRNLRQVRNAYTTDLQTHTELSIFLKQCIEDVKAQVTHHTGVMAHGGQAPTGAITVLGTTFLATERQKVIDLLLSQERVLGLLYAKAFPLPGRTDVSDVDVTKDDIREIFNDSKSHRLLGPQGEESADDAELAALMADDDPTASGGH